VVLDEVPMLPLVLVWPYALGFWLAYAWVFWPQLHMLRQARDLPGEQDAGSLRMILIGGRLSEVAAIIIAITLPAAGVSAPVAFYGLGVTTLVCGGLLRRHCIRMLGPRFTSAVVVTSGQAVIERGAYRWVRHPSYTAGLLITTGIGLALGNWGSLLVLVSVTLLLYAYRVVVEERALTAVLGEEYRGYMRRTKRFIPFVV
jgi:protein-S-isoprenylcysteine O-methyltransferase Ste14